jgi:Ca2+-binding RTX toxin-like protein
MSHESNLGLPFSILNDGAVPAASGMALGTIDLSGAPVLDDLGLIRAAPDATPADAVDMARAPVFAANPDGLIARSAILASHAAHGNIDDLTNAHSSYYAPASASNALSFADQAAPGAIGNHGIVPDVSMNPTITTGGTVTYGGEQVTVTLDSGATVSYNAGLITGATVTIASGLIAGDTLTFSSHPFVTGSYSDGVLTLSGSVSASVYQTVLDSVAYKFESSNDPSSGGSDTSRTIDWQVTGTYGQSNIGTSTLDIHVPPTLTASGTVSYTAGGPAVVLDAALTISDPDSGGNLNGAVINLGEGSVAGDTLHFTNQNGITVSDSSDGYLVLTGTATVADYQAALESVTYTFAPASGDPTQGGTNDSRTVGWTVTDAVSTSSYSEYSTLNVAPDTAPTVSSLTGSAVSGADFANGYTATFTLDASKDVTVAAGTTLLLSDGGIATYVSGTGTTALIFTYSATDAPQALAVTGIGAGSIQDSAGLALPISNLTVAGYSDTVTDTAANVSANFDSLDAAVALISSITLSDGGKPNLDLTVSQVLNDQTLIGEIAPGSYNLVLSDSALQVGAYLNSLEVYASEISSVQLTDGSTADLILRGAEILNDQALIGKIVGPYDLVWTDPSYFIAGELAAIAPYASEISSIETDDSYPIGLTVAQVLAYQALIVEGIAGGTTFGLMDTAATIQANFDALAVDASELVSIIFTDYGTPTFDLTASQVLSGQALIGKIELQRYYTVLNVVLNDSAATVSANFDALAAYSWEFSSVVFTDGGTPNLNLTAYSILNDQALIAKLTPGSCNLILSDTAANIAANFDSLESYASGIASVTFSDGGTPTLDLTQTQVTNDAALLAKIQGPYDLLVTGVTGQAYTSYQNDYDASGKLIQTVDFNPNGSETITGTGHGLTLTGTAHNDTFYLQSAPDVTASGGAGNDLFFFGSGFSSSDQIDGGTGNNTLELDGTYTALTISTSMMTNIQTLELVKGHSFNMTLDAGLVTTGETLTISAATLGAGDALTVNGSALTSGSLVVDAGAGADDLTGGAGTNIFNMAGLLTASDEINGGTGTTRVVLNGDYSAGLTFNSTTITNVGTLDLTAGHSYDLTLNAATVASGQTMTIQGSTLGASDNMTIDGVAVAGSLVIYGGAGTNELMGGAGNDTIKAGSGSDTIAGGAGADKLFAGSGADTFAYSAVSNSTSTAFDIIDSFNTSLDKIELLGGLGGVTAINTAVATGNLSATNFDRALAHDIGAAQLSAHGAVLFTPSTGGYAHDTFLVIDENGVAGYQAGQDLVIELTHGVNLSALSLSNFELAA